MGTESFARLSAEYAQEKGIDLEGFRAEFLGELDTQELPPIGASLDCGEFVDPVLDDMDDVSNYYPDLEKVWLDMRGKDCPQSLRDLIWETIGKVL